MNISARNVIRGKVKEVKPGAVNAEVVLELPGGTLLTAIITLASVKRLGLVAGHDAYAVIKASDIMVATD